MFDVGLVLFVFQCSFSLLLGLSCLSLACLQAPPPPVVPSGVVLAAAPTSSATLVDIADINTGNTDVSSGNLIKKTKNNEKALLLSDDEFQ